MGHNVEQRRNTHTQEHKQHTWAKPHTNTMVQQHTNTCAQRCTKTDTNTEWGIMSTKDAHQVESKGMKEIQKHTLPHPQKETQRRTHMYTQSKSSSHSLTYFHRIS